jgi:hypothetical protein
VRNTTVSLLDYFFWLQQQGELFGLMDRMRALARTAGFPVFAYYPTFLDYDQRQAAVPTLFQTAGQFTDFHDVKGQSPHHSLTSIHPWQGLRMLSEIKVAQKLRETQNC